MKENSLNKLEKSLWAFQILAAWTNQEEVVEAACTIRVKDQQLQHLEIMVPINLVDSEALISREWDITIKINLEAVHMIHMLKSKV